MVLYLGINVLWHYGNMKRHASLLQQGCAFVNEDIEVSTSDCGFAQYNMAALVISTLNIGVHPGESLFSGGEDG